MPSAPYSLALTVNNSGNDESIVIQTVCRKVIFGESEAVTNFPTVDWLWKGVGSTDYVTCTRGTKREFYPPERRLFYPGDVIAFVKTASGSSTFCQEET